VPIFAQFFREARIGQSRSSVLNPLQWLTVILAASLLTAMAFHLPPWVGITITVFLAATVLLLLSAYIFFMQRNPDALRSEKYSLQKMAIEKGLVGDDIAGLINPEKIVISSDIKQLPGQQVEE
jgi:hypothetical protein